MHLNSLINPFLYCYRHRDNRFRNGVQELLGMKKPQAIQPTVGAMRSVIRNVPRGSLKNVPEIEKAVKRTRLFRSKSSDLAMIVDCVHQNYEINSVEEIHVRPHGV